MTEPEPAGSVRAIYAGPWRIDLTDRPGVARLLPWRVLARLAAAALVAARAPRPASIGLILAGDAELAALNARHLGKAGPTDVLSFPLLSPAVFLPRPGRTRPDVPGAPGARPSGPDFVLPPGRRIHLGDIIVSVERAVEQARAGRGGQTGDVHWSAADELRLLVVHGTLHVCGWDHAEPADERAMRALEQRLLAGGR
ncbi:MAG: rRNA maturation RNase YbeY [Candidatus Limnocylindrales bacterium]